MKLLLKIALSILVIFIVIGAGGMFYLSRGLEAGKNVEINEVKADTLSDGAYYGNYKSGRWTNEVKVTVAGGRITDIDVVKDVAIPKPEWTKVLFDRIIEKQSTDVDLVSGATVTCKAYIKSIEDALKSNK